MIIEKSGYSFNVKEDKHRSFWDLLVKDVWEPALFDILKDNLKKDSVYIDIGSWIGPTVLFAAELSEHCYAIEPDEVAFATLKENIALNKNNISCDNIAIMDFDGKVKLGIAGEQGDSMSSVLFDNQSADVTCLTLHSFLQQKNINKVDFIKIDTEGAESIILPCIKELIISMGYPCIHLSIHQKIFKQRDQDIEKILDFCSLYDLPEEKINIIHNSDFYDVFLKK